MHARTLVVLATYNEIENLPGLMRRDSAGAARPRTCWWSTTIRPTAAAAGATKRRAAEPRLRLRASRGQAGTRLGDARRHCAMRSSTNTTSSSRWTPIGVTTRRHLPELLAATDHADVAIGSRYVTGGAIEGWPRHRRLMSRSINGLSRASAAAADPRYERRVPCLSRRKVAQNSIDNVRSTGYAYLEEMLWHLAQGGRHVSPKCRSRSTSAARADRKSALREAAGKVATLLATRAQGDVTPGLKTLTGARNPAYSKDGGGGPITQRFALAATIGRGKAFACR